jgi:KaiC/GvpD/RAD55 family RecA-like ATPase
VVTIKNEITRKSVLTKALEMDFTEDEKEIIAKMIDSLNKKGSNGVSEKVQAERKAEYENIIAYIEDNSPCTATQIAKALDMSVQKVSARLKNAPIFIKPAKGKNPKQFSATPFEEPTNEVDE